MRKLDVSAQYTSDLDRVDVLVWFIDPDTNVSHPEEISEGFAQVYLGSTPQAIAWEFTKFNGTGPDSDGTGGSIKLFWSKPYTDVLDVRIKVTIKDTNGDTHSRMTLVIKHEKTDQNLIVAQNADNNAMLNGMDADRIRQGISDTDISEV